MTRFKRYAAALIAALTLLGCTGVPSPEPIPTTTETPTLAEPVDLSDGEPQDLNYLLRESQHVLLISLMKPLLLDIMQHNYGFLPPADQFDQSQWLPENQVWTWGDPSDSSGVRYVTIRFDHTGLGWQGGSTVTYGPARVISDTTEIKPDATYLVDNTHGVSDLSGELAESVTYRHSRTVTTSQTWTVGLTNKITVGGTLTGIKFEDQAEQAFGFKLDTTQAEADSTDETRSQKLSYKVPVGRAELATLASPTVVTERPLTLEAWWTMPFTITVHKLWLEAAWGTVDGPRTVCGSQYCTTRWNGWDDFVSWMDATNTEFPGHTDPWNPRTRFNPAQSNLPQSGYTLLAMHGTVRSSAQSASEWTFTDVTGRDPHTLDVPDGHTITALP